MEKYYVKYGDFIYCVESRKVSVVKDISEVETGEFLMISLMRCHLKMY